MLSCTLPDLLLPELGRTGWPWTDAPEPLPALMPDGQPWPRISIVTPSFNQGSYLEKTIRSVLLQVYPNLEYIIIDGGSTDQSIEIIRKYEPWLTYWVSEGDRGQTHAINKGLLHCSGALFNWLNSDDFLCPGALIALAEQWVVTQPDLVAGRCLVFNEPNGALSHDWPARPPRQLLDFLTPHSVVLGQPASFVSLNTLYAVGGLREDLHYVMDWELYLRLTMKLRGTLRSAVTPHTIAHSLQHPAAKTMRNADGFRQEACRVLEALLPQLQAEEHACITSHLQHLRSQALITFLLSRPQAALSLCAVSLIQPDLLRLRFFWGALRRAMFTNVEGR